MKKILATTDKKLVQLEIALMGAEEIGLDTESAGPLLRNRKRPFINMLDSKLLGVSIAAGFGKGLEAFYVPVRHKGKNVPFDELDDIMRAVEDVNRVWIHNMKHEGKVYALEGYQVPLGARDSYLGGWLALSRTEDLGLKYLEQTILGMEARSYDPGLSEFTGAEALDYTATDAASTLALGRHFMPTLEDRGMVANLALESRFALLLARMELQGLAVDLGKLRAIAGECAVELGILRDQWDQLFPDISISSAKQLQELFTEGTWTPAGNTATGGYSTAGDAVKAQLKLCPEGSTGHEAARIRLGYQEIAKIASTYSLGYVDEARQWADGKLHPDYNQVGPRTGRLSSSNPNAQNQPGKAPWGPRIRDAYVASRPGLSLTGCDYSQIELRLLAHFAGGRLLEAYMGDADIHQETADALGVDRALGKTVNFGYLAYGGSAWGLAQKLDCSEPEAKRHKAKLEKAYSHVGKFRERVTKKAIAREPVPYVATLTGRRRYIPELLGFGREAARGTRLALNTIIQGGAADLMKYAMIRVDDRARAEEIRDYAMVATIHDEMICESSEPALLETIIQEEMIDTGRQFKLRCPLVANPKSGATWNEIK